MAGSAEIEVGCYCVLHDKVIFGTRGEVMSDVKVAKR